MCTILSLRFYINTTSIVLAKGSVYILENLDGDPKWWGGRIPDTLLINETHPQKLELWKRKRLIPLLNKLLFPVCWSLFLLALGIMFTLLDHRTNFSEFIGATLLLIAPISLGLSIIHISNSHEDSKPLLVLTGMLGNTRIMWFLISTGLFFTSLVIKPTNTMFWNLMIIPNVILWLEWFVFGSFYFSSPAAIWLIKYNPKKELPMKELTEIGWEWVTDSLNPINSSIAVKKSKKSFLEISSTKHNDSYFLILSWWQKGGVRHDPFVSQKLRGLAVPSLTKRFGYEISEFNQKMLDGIELLENFYSN